MAIAHELTATMVTFHTPSWTYIIAEGKGVILFTPVAAGVSPVL